MSNKGRKFPRETLTTDEVNRFLDAFGKGPTATRNRALIVVLLRGGLRLQEALDLETRDLNAKRRTIRIRHGKGDKSRIAKIDTAAWALLQLWLDGRGYLALMPSRFDFVFVTLVGAPLSQQYVRAMVKRIGVRAGILKRVHPHAFRHTFAEGLSREGVKLKTIQLGLGHANASTTDAYVRDLHPQELLDAIDNRPEWRDVTPPARRR